MVNKLTVMLLGLSLLAFSCTSPDRARADNERTVDVPTQTVQPRAVSDEFQLPGTVRARVSTVLSSKIVGQILSVTVREGDRVRREQGLAEIDNREASSQLRRSQAAVAEAERSLDEATRSIQAAEAAVRLAETNQDLAASTRKRYELLRERHSISPQEYDEVDVRYKAATLETERARDMQAAANARRLQISARIEQAEAEVEAARVAQGYSKITSPIDGIVTARQADPGMLAAPGMPLLTLEDDSTYELEVTVEESRVATIRVGQPARIEIDALQNLRLQGAVREIAPSSDPATRSYTVKVQIHTAVPKDRTFRSGFFGRAFFSAGPRDALVIPESALIRRGQLEGVYIVDNNRALLRLVKTSKHFDHQIEIISGLTPGTRIVIKPSSEISDGVKIVDAESGGNR